MTGRAPQTRRSVAKNAVDTYLRQKVSPEFHDIVAMLRTLMREYAPNATEQISYGIPMWKAKGYIAFLSPTKRDITFGFPYAAEFDDRFGLLQGRGKHARHVKIRRLADANKTALRYYIRQALKRDA